MALRDQLRGVTTLISANTNTMAWTGTGFFFKREIRNPQGEVTDLRIWIVTNRHVILNKDNRGNETLADMLVFNLRCMDPAQNKPVWFPITMNQTDLKARCHVHTNPDIDVAVIECGSLIVAALNNNQAIRFSFSAVSEDQIPSNNGFDIDICDDAVALGYPLGYFDEANLFPIVKSGIISTPWGVSFNNQPYFVIDIKLFPGSSGSLVISKPSNDISVNGALTHFPEKKYAFLGVFSAEPYKKGQPVKISEELTIIHHSFYNLGFVWYSLLIPDIIDHGVNL